MGRQGGDQEFVRIAKERERERERRENDRKRVRNAGEEDGTIDKPEEELRAGEE